MTKLEASALSLIRSKSLVVGSIVTVAIVNAPQLLSLLDFQWLGFSLLTALVLMLPG